MYRRTTIVLPPGLKEIATARANKQGISFSEFVRRAVEKAVVASVESARWKTDSFFSDRAVFRGKTPRGTAARHDDYLYGDRDGR